ncbi:unnamed protein product, partial [marine sediment metagenome]
MAVIQNSAIIQKLIDELELYPALDKVPTELAEKILPVFQVNSEQLTIQQTPANVVKHGMESSGGTSIVYTTPATGKFYLTNVLLEGACKNAGATAYCELSVTIDGTVVEMIKLKVTTGGDYHGCSVINLNNPVLIDKATAINIICTQADF